MAYKMKGFSYPGTSPMKQSKFPNSTKALNRKKNKQTDNKDKSLKTNQNVQVDEVSVGGEKTEKRKIAQVQQIPMTLEEPVLEKADYTPIATANKNKKSRAKFRSDVGSFINGLTGIPEDIVEGVADAGGWVAKGIGNKATKIKANRLARKQDNIDNPKPEKVKKVKVKKVEKVNKATTKKSNNEIKANKQASNNYTYNFNAKQTPEAPKSKPSVKPKSNVRVMTKKELKKANKKPSKLGKSLKNAGGMIGEQLITQGIGAGIQALLTPREKKQRERGNPNLSGFSQMQFGRRKNKE